MPLIDIWEKSQESVLEMSIQQIVPIAGDGSLKDESKTSEELRHFLSEVDSKYLRIYAKQILSNSFTDSGLVLQDIINEAGRRLGLHVTNGIYRGKQKHNNCDGIWRTNTWTFVVEVKTTDAYSIQLDKIAAYLKSEVEESDSKNASCLIVVGRQDTATLEDQLRGSKHNWSMRIVGVDALFDAIELRELTEDKSLSDKIIDLFMPQEFTRVDKIISTAFDFAADVEEAGFKPQSESDESQQSKPIADAKRSIVSNPEQIEEFKNLIWKHMSSNYNVEFTRNRSSFESPSLRFAIAVSKEYERRDKYWYAYHPRQREFLADAQEAFFVLGCLDIKKAFAIPYKIMNEIASEMLTTSPKGDETKTYQHVVIREDEGRFYIFAHPTKRELDINEFEIKILPHI